MRFPAVYFYKGEPKMKKFGLLVLCVLFMLGALGCGGGAADTVPALKNTYYAEGNFKLISTPYLYLNEDNTFIMGAGAVFSYAEYGTYQIVGDSLVVTSQSNVYTFRIMDSDTLVLIEGRPFKLPVNTRFLYKEELK